MKIDLTIEAWHRLAEAAEVVGRDRQDAALLRDAAAVQHEIGLTAISSSTAAEADRITALEALRADGVAQADQDKASFGSVRVLDYADKPLSWRLGYMERAMALEPLA